ncbi:MAG: hypothetical protein FWH03_07460 [Firmicutes bacterium]|nr:hypothetical protein [Bacillota bacterium]
MTISFPHLASYHIPITTLLQTLFPAARVLPPPAISPRTLHVGARHSPDFVCAPFKYNVGNFIEALQQGADVLFQAGGGCRFGFYADLQEQILRDLGYNFRMIKLFGSDGLSLKKLRAAALEAGAKLSYPRIIHALLIAIKSIRLIDELEFYARESAAFTSDKNTHESLLRSFKNALLHVRTLRGINKLAAQFRRTFNSVQTSVPHNALKIGIIGELFDVMEPFANRFLERELYKHRAVVTRFVNATYLLTQKKKLARKVLQDAAPYLKYPVGAEGTLSVAACAALAQGGYDGVIHVKPFACAPEVNAVPALNSLSRDTRIPVLYLSFDTQDAASLGMKTRVEAFIDMLKMKKQGGIL